MRLGWVGSGSACWMMGLKVGWCWNLEPELRSARLYLSVKRLDKESRENRIQKMMAMCCGGCFHYLAIEDNRNGWSKRGFISDTGAGGWVMLILSIE